MPLNLTSALAKSGAKAAAVGISFAVGGPLGALTGAFLGALLGEASAEFGREAIEQLIEKAGEGTLGRALEGLADRFAQQRPGIEAIQRKALLKTLQELRPANGDYGEWFDNWEACLGSRVPLELEELTPGEAATADPERLFRHALERLDAQGAAIRHTRLSLNREADAALIALVRVGLDERFEANFKELLTEPENAKAWIEAQQVFQSIVLRKLESIEGTGRATLTEVRGLRAEFTPEVLAGLAAIGRQGSPGQEKQIDELAKELNTTRDAVIGFLSIVHEEPVALEQLPARLAQIAQRHVELLERLSALDPEDASARAFIEEARELIGRAKGAADYDQADDLLRKAEDAQEATLEQAVKLERAAAEAARRLRASRAATRAERGGLSMTRLRYLEAAGHFQAAAEMIKADDAKLRFSYLIRSASALKSHGDEMGDNAALRRAIEAYKEILREFPRERTPLDWAMTQNNLGNALWRLGERENGTERLVEAVAAYRAALEEHTRERVPLRWAMTQNNLGVALQTLGEREGGTERLKEAVAAYRAALEEYTRGRTPLDWAMAQNNLGAALNTLGERESGTERLEEAVAAYRAALEECRRERVPLNWAATQSNLGNVLRALGERESGTERLEEAVAAYRAALEERTRGRVPLDWATTQNNLGTALGTLGERESGTEWLEEAVAAFRAALEERTRERVPLDWAMTQNNLGAALRMLGERESGAGLGFGRLEEAVAAYRAALEERTRERLPLDWATTQSNLGNALATLGEWESGTGRLEEAVAAYRAALEERTRERVPLDWAGTQNNLGDALATLGERGSGTGLLREAAEALRAAWQVYRAAGMRQYDADFEGRIWEIWKLIAKRS